jgi:hypothetical protein
MAVAVINNTSDHVTGEIIDSIFTKKIGHQWRGMPIFHFSSKVEQIFFSKLLEIKMYLRAKIMHLLNFKPWLLVYVSIFHVNIICGLVGQW